MAQRSTDLQLEDAKCFLMASELHPDSLMNAIGSTQVISVMLKNSKIKSLLLGVYCTLETRDQMKLRIRGPNRYQDIAVVTVKYMRSKTGANFASINNEVLRGIFLGAKALFSVLEPIELGVNNIVSINEMSFEKGIVSSHLKSYVDKHQQMINGPYMVEQFEKAFSPSHIAAFPIRLRNIEFGPNYD